MLTYSVVLDNLKQTFSKNSSHVVHNGIMRQVINRYFLYALNIAV